VVKSTRRGCVRWNWGNRIRGGGEIEVKVDGHMIGD